MIFRITKSKIQNKTHST